MGGRLQPAFWGGLFIGVLSALPFVSVGNCCCCLWVVAGGVLAADDRLERGEVLALLGDGVPRSRRAIVAALAGRHPRDEVARTLMRLAVTGRLAEAGGKHTPAGTGEAGQE